jgi:hypothetical protein
MGCVVEQDGDRWLIDVDHPAYPRPKADDWKPVPIGDLVEKGLTAIGITKERVESITRRAGVKSGCGCADRQKWMNEVGFKVQWWARRKLEQARDFYYPQ